jgi:hypothetical protein
MTTLEDASEIDLMTAWLKKRRAVADLSLTRLGRTEVRHVCLYASQQLSGLRTTVLDDGCNSGHVILELRDVITDLESLVAYLETGKGGFSALKDKNTSINPH